MTRRTATAALIALLIGGTTGWVLAQTARIETHYKDIAADNPHLTGIQFVTEAKLMTGYEDGTWRPDQPVTRQQLATILERYTARYYRPANPPPMITTLPPQPNEEPPTATTTPTTTYTTTTTIRQNRQIPKPAILPAGPTSIDQRIECCGDRYYVPIWGHLETGTNYWLQTDWFRIHNQWWLTIGNYPGNDRTPVPVGDYVWFQADICDRYNPGPNGIPCYPLIVDYIEGGYDRTNDPDAPARRYNDPANVNPPNRYPPSSSIRLIFPIEKLPPWVADNDDDKVILRITSCGDGRRGCLIYPHYGGVVDPQTGRHHPGWQHR